VNILPTLVVVVSAATVTACGGTSPTYAGMSAAEAASQALAATAEDAKQQGDPLHGRKLRLARVVRGDDEGRDAWVVVFNVGKRERACVWIWADQRVVSVTYNYFVDTCTPKVLRAKADIVAP
jgi:hypothetical protein